MPTEAEWEYAARGGQNNDRYKYSGSDNVHDVAWFSANSLNRIQPVGSKAPNSLGTFDMSGNVWEWCSDYYGSYSSSKKTNPFESVAGSLRVNRGGGWCDYLAEIYIGNRDGNTPATKSKNMGFRICMTATN